MSINSVNVVGNLTRDSEIKKTPSGKALISFSIAINDRRKNSEGQWVDKPCYIDCFMFGEKRVLSLVKFLKRGVRVALKGSLSYSSWEKDGQRRHKHEIRVEDLELMSAARNDEDDDYEMWERNDAMLSSEDIAF